MSETIMMIHGMWGNAWYWENYKKYFEEKGYNCIAPTLRYHDADPKDNPHPKLGTISLLDYVEDLEKEIKKLDTKPIIIGHSMGGLLAQILASRGLAKTLVLLTTAAPAGIMALKLSVIKSFLSAFKRYGFWRKPHRPTFNEASYSVMSQLSPEEQKEIYSKFVYKSGRAACEIGFWLFDKQKTTRVDETKITCPVLVISGKKDRITPASVVKKVAEKYKAVATYKEFENHAHWVVGETGWQEITEYICEWLKANVK